MAAEREKFELRSKSEIYKRELRGMLKKKTMLKRNAWYKEVCVEEKCVVKRGAHKENRMCKEDGVGMGKKMAQVWERRWCRSS